MTHLVFVYGTLKRSQPNYWLLQDTASGSSTFKCVGETVTCYPLVIAGKNNIPFLLDSKDNGHNIVGEVFEVDDKKLDCLDEFEGYPKLYSRQKIRVHVQESADTFLEAWCYIATNYKLGLLQLPFLRCYDTNDDHGRPYCVEEDTNDPEEVDPF